MSLSGFKTVVINDVRLVAATANEVKATLEVGQLTETIEVKAGTELVQTQSTTVQSTLKVEQLQELPLVSRNALYAVMFLPGVETPTGGGTRRDHDQRPAAEHDQHHDRRHQRPATSCSRPTASSRWSRRVWTRSRKSR